MTVRRLLCCSAIVLGLASCGGEDGAQTVGSGLSAAAPTPTPTPSPIAAAAVGLILQRDYTVLGFSETVTTNPDNGSPPSQDYQLNWAPALSFRFISEADAFEIGVPGIGARLLKCLSLQSFTAHCDFGTEPISARRLGASLFRPGSANPKLTLEATSLVSYATSDGPTVTRPTTLYSGALAYGVPTAPTKIPQAGQAAVKGVILGSGDFFEPIDLLVNFATRRIGGNFDVVERLDGVPPRNLGRFGFDGEIAADGSFRGSIVGSDGARLGEFEGRFTGNGAQELMLKLLFAFSDPKHTTMRTRAAVVGGTLVPVV